MHTVQDTLRNAQELNDDDLVDAVVTAWDIVCEENECQRDLVTVEQFNQWETYRTQAKQKMTDAIEDYDGSLTTVGRENFESIAMDIATVAHKSEAELIQEKRDRGESVPIKKENWLATLKRLFHLSPAKQ